MISRRGFYDSFTTFPSLRGCGASGERRMTMTNCRKADHDMSCLVNLIGYAYWPRSQSRRRDRSTLHVRRLTPNSGQNFRFSEIACSLFQRSRDIAFLDEASSKQERKDDLDAIANVLKWKLQIARATRKMER